MTDLTHIHSRGHGPGSHKTALTGAIRAKAYELGFDLCRFAPVETASHAKFFEHWLGLGRAGEMGYLERTATLRRDPSLLAPRDSARFRTIIVLAVNYHQFDPPAALLADLSRGVIASYAWSDDYHEVVRPLLYEIDAFIRSRTGRSSLGKCLVDTGPVLERDWAQRAGLGFTGKNCCTIHPGTGSWLFLATILIPETLDFDPLPRTMASQHQLDTTAHEVLAGLPPRGDYGAWLIAIEADGDRAGTCGSCARCLVACPTDAFAGPYHLDPARCISYWTIESRQAIPRALRPRFLNRIFGCDVCQDVCPWNRRLPLHTPLQEGLRARHERVAPPLLDGFRDQSPYWLDPVAFREHFQRSPVLRAKREGMLRNVCVALGNWANVEALPALSRAVVDPEALARGHAAWALGCIAQTHRSESIVRTLEAARSAEPVEWVREEMSAALDLAT